MFIYWTYLKRSLPVKFFESGSPHWLIGQLTSHLTSKHLLMFPCGVLTNNFENWKVFLLHFTWVTFKVFLKYRKAVICLNEIAVYMRLGNWTYLQCPLFICLPMYTSYNLPDYVWPFIFTTVKPDTKGMIMCHIIEWKKQTVTFWCVKLFNKFPTHCRRLPWQLLKKRFKWMILENIIYSVTSLQPKKVL